MRSSTLRGWRLAAISVGLGPAVAACAAPLACTAMGCESVVSVDIAALAPKARPLSAMATLCVQNTCQTQKVTFLTDAGDALLGQTLPADPKPVAGMQVPVTLKVVQGSTVLLDTRTTATLVQFAPNGTTCGPICYSASLVLSGDSLVPSPSATSSASQP